MLENSQFHVEFGNMTAENGTLSAELELTNASSSHQQLRVAAALRRAPPDVRFGPVSVPVKARSKTRVRLSLRRPGDSAIYSCRLLVAGPTDTVLQNLKFRRPRKHVPAMGY
jgi:hypothetical protein